MIVLGVFFLRKLTRNRLILYACYLNSLENGLLKVTGISSEIDRLVVYLLEW